MLECCKKMLSKYYYPIGYSTYRQDYLDLIDLLCNLMVSSYKLFYSNLHDLFY